MAKLADLVATAKPLEASELDPILEAAVESQPVLPNSAAVVVDPEPPIAPQPIPQPVPVVTVPSKPFQIPPWVFVVGGGLLTVVIAGLGGTFNAPNAPRNSAPTAHPKHRWKANSLTKM